MDITQFVEKTAEIVTEPMIQFLTEWGGEGYTVEDVKECEALILGYLDALAAMEPVTDAAIMAQVETLVLELNDLNEKTDYGLIETEAREAIWEVIQTSAVARGLQDVPEDVTEEWRDW